MKRYLWIFLALLALPFMARAQGAGYSTVSGVILDPNGVLYQNCKLTAAFVPAPQATTIPTIGGSTFQTDVPGIQCDSFAAFTVVLADNNVVSDGHPAGTQQSQWRFSVCSNTTPLVCFPLTMVITGTTMDISAQMHAAAAVLPAQSGGGGLFTFYPLTWSSTISLIGKGNSSYGLTLAGNVTSTTILNTQLPGTIFTFNICQPSSGGVYNYTFSPPGSFVGFPPIATGIGACTPAIMQLNNAGQWTTLTSTQLAAFYQQVQNNTGNITQRGILNCVPPLQCVDNGGATRTDLTSPAFVGAGGSHAAGSVPDPGAVVHNYPLCDTGTFAATCAGAGASFPINSPNPAPFNVDVQFGGPNPYYDVRKSGGYVGDNFATPVNGTMSAVSSTLTISSAQDYVNGNGLVVLAAGPTPVIATPTGVAVVPLGATGGTSYSYCVVHEDYANGRTICSTAGTTATGVATLGIQTVNNSLRQRVGGIVQITTAAAHHFVTGSQVNVATGDGNFDGAFTITSTPSGTTFTYNQYGVADFASTATSGTSQVGAKNFVTWNAPTAYTTLRSYIYRCLTSCGAIGVNYALAGVAQGMDSSFVDYGFSVTAASIGDGDVSATAPVSVNNEWLPTTIVSGGGTTVLTLAALSTNAVAGVKVLHDNATILTALCSTGFVTGQGGTIYIPAAIGGTNSKFPINSTLRLGETCGKQYEIVVAAPIWAGASIFPGGLTLIRGVGAGNSSSFPAGYLDTPTGLITGTAYPQIYYLPNHSGNSTIKNMVMVVNQPYQAAVVQDNDTTGNGPTLLNFEDVSLSGSTSNTPYIAKGGFGYFWKGGSISTSPLNFNSPPAVLFTNNCGIGQSGQEGPSIFYMDKTSIFGGMVWDACGAGDTGPGGFNHMEFKEILMENAYIPVLRTNLTSGATIFAVSFINTSYSDLLGGSSTPMFDLTNMGSNRVTGFNLINPFCATGSQPALEVSTSLSAYNGIVIDNEGGCTIIGAQTYRVSNGVLGIETFQNWEIGLQSGGRLFYQLPGPISPVVSTAVSAGGSVPVATHTYTVAAIDIDGHASTTSSGVTAVVTGGNQTVTITGPAALPAGAVGWNLYRDNSSVNGGGCATPQFTTPGFVFVDTSNTTCSSGPSTVGDAGTASISSKGLGGINIYQPTVAALATAIPNVLNEGNLNNWPAFNVNGGATHNYPGILGAVTTGHTLCSTGTLFEYIDCLNGGVNPSVNLALANYCTGGTQICGIAVPVSPNGRIYIPTTTPSGGVGQAITFIQPGISTRAVLSGGTDTILTSDIPFQVYYNTGGAVATTIPALSTAGFANFALQTNTNLAAGGTVITFTLASGLINGAANFVQGVNTICKWSTHDGTNLDASCPSAPSVTGSGTTGSLAKFVASTQVGNADLAGDCVTVGTTTCTIPANTVTAAKSAIVLTRRTCDIGIGDTSSTSAISNAQLGPQKRVCFIPFAATIVEVDVSADAGTPNIIIGKNTAGTQLNILSSALATAASGGIACSNTGGTTGIDGATTCSATLQNTALASGAYLELVSGTAGGTAKWMTAHIVFTVN